MKTNMKTQELINKCKVWGVSKGITGPNGKGTIEKQFAKFIEEMHEYFTAKTAKEKMDALGDMQVVAIQAHSLIEGVDEDIEIMSLDGLPNSLANAAFYLPDYPANAFNYVRAAAVLDGFDPDECLQMAYDVISKRSGTMVDGVFVKDSQ